MASYNRPPYAVLLPLALGLMFFAVLANSCERSAPEERRQAAAPDTSLLRPAQLPADSVVVKTGFFEHDKARFYYKTMGKGEPILILHGGPGLDHSYFLPQIAPLAKTHKLIFFDQRAHGRTTNDSDTSTLSLQTMLADIDAVRRHFGNERVHVLGHSWGGLLAMFYAVSYPQHLNSLILVSPTAASSKLRAFASRSAVARTTPQDSIDRAQLQQTTAFKNREPQAVEAFFRIAYRNLFRERALADSMTLYIPPNMAENSAKLRYVQLELKTYDIHSALNAISAPTLIIHGAYDLNPLEVVETIKANIPGSQLAVLENSGHFPFIETPEEFFMTVRRFIADVH